MEEFCYFFTLGKQHAVGSCQNFQEENSSSIDDNTHHDRQGTEDQTAADTHFQQEAVTSVYKRTHNESSDQRFYKIGKNSGIIGNQLPHGDHIERRNHNVSQQSADGGADNADVGIACQNVHSSEF